MVQLPSLLFKYNKGSFDHILEWLNPRCKRMFKGHLINALHGSKIFKIGFLKINKCIISQTPTSPFPKPKKETPL